MLFQPKDVPEGQKVLVFIVHLPGQPLVRAGGEARESAHEGPPAFHPALRAGDAGDIMCKQPVHSRFRWDFGAASTVAVHFSLSS